MIGSWLQEIDNEADTIKCETETLVSDYNIV